MAHYARHPNDIMLEHMIDCYALELGVDSISIGQLRTAYESTKSVILDKLYTIIANKISTLDPDFQDIMDSKGQYSKYKYFITIHNTIQELTGFIKESSPQIATLAKQQLGDIFQAHDNLIKYEKKFREAFMYSLTPVKQYYLTIVSSIIYAMGFIVTAMTNYEMHDGNVAYTVIFKNENILERGLPKNMYRIIQQFNIDIKDNSLIKSIDNLKKVQPTIKSESGEIILEVSAVEVIALVGGIALGLLALPAIIRYVIYFFLHSKLRLSEYITQQAYFLELNVRKLKAKPTTDPKVIKKQESYITKLKMFAAKLSGDKYVTEKVVARDIDNEDREVVQSSEQPPIKSNDDNSEYNDSDIML